MCGLQSKPFVIKQFRSDKCLPKVIIFVLKESIFSFFFFPGKNELTVAFLATERKRMFSTR